MEDEVYMRRAIELAKKGRGWTNPNPMVGAVIVKNNRIIAEGYHHRCGDLHAERDALKNLKESAKGATIYVTLEPCCHQGKQPPCCEAVYESGITRVVIGSRDPNPLVAGKGAQYLRSKGITVEEDFLRPECDQINPVFFHYITSKRPYVVMKYAMTLDGKISTRTGASKWITGEEARRYVHYERSYYNAIMAGIGTVIADDPMLNVRDIEGAHQPVRIIVDSGLNISTDSAIVKSAKQYETYVVCINDEDFSKCMRLAKNKIEKIDELISYGVNIIETPEKNGHVDLKYLMDTLGAKGIDSVYVEGGGTLHEACMKAGIVNHISAYVAPKIFGGADAKTPVEGVGVSQPDEAMMLDLVSTRKLGKDLLLEYDVN